MKSSTQLTFLLAEHMPMETMLKHLKTAIFDYEQKPNDATTISLTSICMLVVQKGMVDQIGMDKISAHMNEIDNLEQMAKHFNQKQ